jgi:hypothetical protein
LRNNKYFIFHKIKKNQKIQLTFKKSLSDSKVPPILARSGEKINFTIKKSPSTLTWVAGVAKKMIFI